MNRPDPPAPACHRTGSGRDRYRLALVFLCSTLSFVHLQFGWGQGTVWFNNSAFGLRAPVYGPETCDDCVYKTGNTSAGTPAGIQFYTGSLLIGSGFRAQLLGAPGSNQPSYMLQAAMPTTTFRTGTAAGLVAAATATFGNVPADAPVATVQLVAWDNTSGLYPNWSTAYNAWLSGSIAAGGSEPINVYNIGGSNNVPPVLADLRSFNFYYTCVPKNPTYISSQPTNQTVLAGDPATFSVSVSGTQSFQWRLNGAVIDSATNSSYTLAAAQPGDAGNYSVLVTNTCQLVLSTNATLTVLTSPVIVTQPQSQTVAAGGHVTNTVSARGPAPLSYQWRLNGSDIAGRTNASYRIAGAQAADAGDYVAVVTNSYGSATSAVATLTVVAGFTLSVVPSGGGTVSLDAPGGVYPSNSVAAAAAYPGSGWAFLGWLGDASGTNSVVSVLMNHNKTIQAVFGTVLSNSVSGGGSISLYPALSLYPYGGVVRLTANQPPPWYLNSWGGAVGGNDNPLYFTVTNANPAISAVFLSTNAAVLTVVPNGFGRVTANPRANAYTLGSTVNLTAIPDSQQTFLGWSGDASGTNNPLPLVMNQTKAVTANFTEKARLSAAPPIEGFSAAGFRFLLTGALGPYEVFGSANLANWVSLGLLTNSFGEAQFTDPMATGVPSRFYRALSR